MRRSTETRKEYVYLIQEREFVRSNEQTYKIGRTKNFFNRMASYPKDSEILMLCDVDNCAMAEKTLKTLFKKEFVEQRQYGCEYFSGDINRMKSLMSQTLFPTIAKAIKILKPLPKIPKMLQRLRMKNKPPSKPLPQLPAIQVSTPKVRLNIRTKAILLPKTKNVKLEITSQHQFLSRYKCHKCDEVFDTKQTLRRHLNKQYPCDNKCLQCDYETTSIRQLNKHVKAKHPETKIPAVESALARHQSKKDHDSLYFRLLPGNLTLKKGFWIINKQVAFYSGEFKNVIVIYFNEMTQELCYSYDDRTQIDEFYIWHDMLQPEIDVLRQRIKDNENVVVAELELLLV